MSDKVALASLAKHEPLGARRRRTPTASDDAGERQHRDRRGGDGDDALRVGERVRATGTS